MRDAPDDLGTGIAFISAPPEPFVPPEMHFKPVVGMIVCWTGEHEEGERVVAPIREALQPVMDMVQPMPYTALQSMLDASGPHGIRGYFKADFMDDLSDGAIGSWSSSAPAGPARSPSSCWSRWAARSHASASMTTALGRRDVSVVLPRADDVDGAR